MASVARWFGWAVLIPTGLLTLLGAIAAWWWPGEIVVHWTLHAGLAILVVWALVFRHGWMARISAALAALALLPWLAVAWSPRAPEPDAGAATMQVAVGNLYTANQGPERAAAIAALAEAGPDLVVLAESVINRRVDDPAALRARFAHVLATPGRGTGGNVIASRHPMRITWRDERQALYGAVLEATIDLPGGPLRVISLHPMSPLNAFRIERRAEMLAAVAARVRALPGPVIVLGDCNCTRVSPAWAAFLADSGLSEPPGRQPATWPSQVGPLGIGIDHILVRGLAISPLRIVDLPGSDHRGLAAAVALPAGGG
jgi:endonuclease/exonuclease/phosphatase (EEP) superfamily protein YafD